MGPRKASALPGWFITGHLAKLPSGEVVVRDLAIEPEHEGQPGVSTDVLRMVSGSQIVARVRAYLASLPGVLALDREFGQPEFSEDDERELAAAAASATSTMSAPGAGGRGFGDDFFEQLARDCLEEYALRGRGVTQRIAKKRKRSPETVRQWMRRRPATAG